mgnify:CR=1 FL=1
MYPAEMIKPMREDLTSAGFAELHTREEVDKTIKQEGTTLLVVNSVCGCAAANARPAAKVAMTHANKPNRAATVFAGVDREAVEAARELMIPFPPSSPSIALFKDGQLVHMLERHHIEGRSAEMIAANLKDAFDQHCS